MNSLATMFESSQRLSLSACEEALLAGRPLVGVEDLFLALFSAGGQSSRFLAGAGVSLAAARSAVAAVHADRFAALGGSSAQSPPRPRSRGASASAKLDFSEPAQKVLGNVSEYDDDRHVLIATANSSDGLVADVLERLGVDVPSLREEAAEATGAPDTAPPPPTLVDDAFGSWLRVTVPWHLAATPEEVRALVTDPSQWERWNDREGERDVDTSGMVSVTDPKPSRWLAPLGVRARRSRYELVDTDEPTYVRWDVTREPMPERPGRRRASRQRLGIRLEATPEGTAVTYESDWLLRRRPGQVRRKVLASMMMTRMIVQGSAIARALSEAADLAP